MWTLNMICSLLLSYLCYLSYFISFANFFCLHGFLCFPGVCAIDRSKLREEFLIYLNDARLASPLVVGRWNFQVVVNGKTPIGSSQMDTVKNQGAFYKQANVHNDAEKHARTTSRNGYFVLKRTTKSCRLWLRDIRALSRKNPGPDTPRSRARIRVAFTRRVISIRDRKRARARRRDL